MGHKVKQSLMSSRIDFFYYTFRNILLVSIPLLVVSSVVLSHLSSHSSAASSSSGVDQIQFSLSSSCTMSSVVDKAHTKEINNGTYHSDVGKTTIKTLCNDGNGYSVYAVGYSNNEEGNNKLINSERPEYSIDTGLNTSGLTSQWAMKLNNIPDDPSPTPPTIESDYNNTYGLVPPYWTKVASRASGTTDMAEGSSFTTTYAVYASSSQYAGTYQGQVKYLLTHPAYPSNFHFMQDVGKWKNELALEESVQAIDARDGKKYWVTKLKDGNIWMTQNLDLEIDAARTYTHNDTDLGWDPNSFNANAIWTSNKSTIDFDIGSTVPGWQRSDKEPYSANPGDIYYYTSNSNASDAQYGSLQQCIDAGHDDCPHYHAGNYYNYAAATASSGTTVGAAANSVCPRGWRLPNNSTSDDANNEFGKLFYYSYGIITMASNGTSSINYSGDGFSDIRTSPLWFTRSGRIQGNSVGYSKDYGFYHSRAGYNTYIYSGGVYLAFRDDSSFGLSVRCVAR